jgi:hypothetical protein
MVDNVKDVPASEVSLGAGSKDARGVAMNAKVAVEVRRGDVVDYCDFDGKWLPAIVIEVREDGSLNIKPFTLAERDTPLLGVRRTFEGDENPLGKWHPRA